MLTYLPVLAMIAVPFSLVLIQPDLGTSFMLLIGGLAVVFAAGLPRPLCSGVHSGWSVCTSCPLVAAL